MRPLLSALVIFSTIFCSAQTNLGGRLPKYMTAEEKSWIEKNIIPVTNKTEQVFTNPYPDMIVPGEFEESQAVVVTWDKYVGDVRRIQCDIIKAIQPECQAWIIITSGNDSNVVKSTMNTYGYSLYNYRFFVFPNNAFWTRDYGPIGFYYSGLDSLGFIDLKYYPGRPSDNQVPGRFGTALGIPVLPTSLYMEGGNFMCDGFGRSFHSGVLAENNNYLNGWTTAFTNTTAKDLFNSHVAAGELVKLNYDGGTGHIDLYTKQIDEQNIMAVQFPAGMCLSDSLKIEDNIAYMKLLDCPYTSYDGRRYKIHRLGTPTNDDGTSHTNCTQLDYDPRSYNNGTWVNKTFIMPIYSNSVSGNASLDAEVVAQIKTLLPGYTIAPIDARTISPWGGELHCITMQIPTANPIRFWHPSVEDLQPSIPQYNIVAAITNKSGIATAVCKWRIQGTNTWHRESLTPNSSGRFEGFIPNKAFRTIDTIEYYLEAASNNGKIMTKPMVASNGGYYKFYTSENYNPAPEDGHYLFGNYPNPSLDNTTIPFYIHEEEPSVKISITDLLGRTIEEMNYTNVQPGLYEYKLDLSKYSSGVFMYSLVIGNERISTRELTKMK